MLEAYKDLVEMIGINEEILYTCKANLKEIRDYFIKSEAPKGYSVATSYVDADCIHGGKSEMHLGTWQRLVEECSKLESMIYLQEEMLKNLYKVKKNTDDKLRGLEGLEYKVCYLKYVEGNNLQQISSKLGYSYQYIKEIHAKTYKLHTDKLK